MNVVQGTRFNVTLKSPSFGPFLLTAATGISLLGCLGSCSYDAILCATTCATYYRLCCSCCGTKKEIRFFRYQESDLRHMKKLTKRTPSNGVLPEKLKGPQLVKKFPAFYGTQKFITAFTCPYPELDQSNPFLPHSTSRRSILILSSHIRQVVSFPQVSPPKSCTYLCSPTYMLHAPPITFFLDFSP